MNYYNENEPYAARWLRNLIDAGHIGYGIIDDRDLRTLEPTIASGFTRAHFFAGIAGWDLALQYAGWPEDRVVWTGSCPCQPFSVAGKRKGEKDERHLWPVWLEHIRQLRPATVFGEQVSGKAGREWLTGVRLDLEALGYAVGAADLAAAGLGAPHIRQRLYWVAYTPQCHPRSIAGDDAEAVGIPGEERPHYGTDVSQRGSRLGRVARSEHTERRRERPPDGDTHGRNGSGGRGDTDRLADAATSERRRPDPERPALDRPAGRDGATGFWSLYELIPCLDGKARRVEPGVCPLAYGVSQRVGQLRAYGNAIVPPLAAVFIQAFLDSEETR